MKLHLETGGQIWCDDAQDHESSTEDPRDSTCAECLKRAASFGAAAAMRYAAVEAGATRDPELVKERDEAMKRLNVVSTLLEGQGAFFCTDCLQLFRLTDRALHAGRDSWCRHCAPLGAAR